MSHTNKYHCVQLGKCIDKEKFALDVHFSLWPIIAIPLYIHVDYPLTFIKLAAEFVYRYVGYFSPNWCQKPEVTQNQ